MLQSNNNDFGDAMPSHSRFAPARLLTTLLIAALVGLANVAVWYWTHPPVQAPDWSGKVGGFAYAPFQRDQSPLEGRFPTDSQIRADLQLIKRHSDRIRTYSSTESPAIPRIAAELGLKVAAGARLDKRNDTNLAEVDALIALAKSNPAIERAIVGNEAILRGDLTAQQLIRHLDKARQRLRVPVSTAEPWHIWLKYPELAEHVDYLGVHLLPYWEGVPRRDALDDAMRRYRELREAFPDKPIVVGEIGWPSNGDRFKSSRASVADQAAFLRRWFALAEREHIDYYVMEAFDQPWKEATAGRVEAYWGMFDAGREAKYPLEGPIQEDPQWLDKASIAVALAALPMLWFVWHFWRFQWLGKVFFAGLIQAASALLVWSIGVPFDFYLEPFDWTMLAVLLPAQLAILGILLANGFEFTEAIWTRWLRAAQPLRQTERTEWPFVSIHLACHNEPPEMVIATLDSLALLDYPHFEVLVLDNNTEKDEVWQPVRARCRELGERFRFFHLKPWPGFKAGALNFGLDQTDPRAEIVGVVDADYVVRPDWLRSLVGHFDAENVAIVQCPQAHRDFEGNAFRRMCNWEYEGFFRIGMHHRNERDAIIQHGTMTLIRRKPLVETGRWAEWCICEDAELGLRLFNAGWSAQYVDMQMGKGLTPADFTAYKSQRFRWAFGAMQILRHHLGWLLKPGKLSAGQRFHFLTGWFSWFADALHLVFSLMAIVWSIGMLIRPDIFSLPLQLFLIPVLGFFVSKAVFGIVLYRLRVPCSWSDTLGAAVASMALSHAIARGVLKGLAQKEHPFTRTAKSRRLRKRPSALSAVREESLLFAALSLCALGIAVVIGTEWLEVRLWIAILLAQSLPYLSAMASAWVSARAGEAVTVASEVPVPMAVTHAESTPATSEHSEVPN